MKTLRIASRTAALTALALVLAFAPAAQADQAPDIGFVDQAALSSIPAFTAAKQQLDAFGGNLQKEYIARARGASQAEQQRLSAEFQQKIGDKQRSVLGPIFARAQVAIASVASSKNLSVVVDKQIVIVGGVDITSAVRDLLTGVGEPVPPVNTPPPSTVGYVDQQQIDAVPSIKAAAADFAKFKATQDQAAAAKFKNAKTPAERDAIMKDYQKALTDKQNQTLKPLVDKTTAAMASVAQKRGLTLVVDRGNVIYGGTDITSDVTSALK
ncbi:MAG TPA: OmpH family outer membrane protein [Candidatus Lustribacter sp.]|jgi:outer membrane protein|nr:OmpH family outer membrane protein [Candidatus Lustribacter sp.]